MTFEEWLKTWPISLNNDFTIREESIMEEAWDASAEANKPRWIPVSERLPDKEEMICAVIIEGFECAVIRIWLKKNWFNVPSHLNVTHWLELPEMPE